MTFLPFILLVLGPMVALLLNFGDSFVGGESDWSSLLLPQGRRLTLLLRSIGLALAVAIGGILLSIFAATALWRWRRGPASYLRWFLFVLAPIPPYLHALGWSSFILELNTLLTSWGFPSIMMRGWAASWWVQMMAFTPLVIGVTLIGFESIDPVLVEAARIQRSDLDGFIKITLPLAAPIILAGGSFVFLLSMIDYSVPSLFQVSTYSLEIFAEFSASNQPIRALILALPLLIITLVTISLSQRALRNTTMQPAWKSRLWELPPRWSNGFLILQSIAIFLLLSQIMVPLISQAVLAASLENIIFTVQAAKAEIISTWWIAFFTILISLPIALPIAQKLLEKRTIWWGLVTLPLAIPSPLIGIGLILIWNHPSTQNIYTSIFMPVFAAIARFTPLAAILLFTQLRRIDPLLLDAARLLQRNELQSWLKVHLPLLIPGMLGTAGILFILTAGELGATLLVAPPGQATLTMRIYNFLHYGASDTVAGLGLMMTVAVLLFGVLAAGILAGWSLLSSRRVL
jgi:iron(III) transport system permease protein